MTRGLQREQLWRELKILELLDQLENEGYNVSREYSWGNRCFDVFAERGPSDRRAIEVKTHKLSSAERDALRAKAEYIEATGGTKFEIYSAMPSVDRSIEFIGLEDALFEYFMENFPSNLDALSTHTCLEEVSDVDIYQVEINKDSIRVVGEAFIGVTLQYGSDREQEPDDNLRYMSFPFEFDVVLNHDLWVESTQSLEIDTSSFYI